MPEEKRLFKTGYFYYFIPRSNDKVEIKRNDSFQIETNLSTNIYNKFKVHWINDCEYLLVPVGSNNILKDGVDSFLYGYTYDIRILHVERDYYIFSTKVDSANKSMAYSDTIWMADKRLPKKN